MGSKTWYLRKRVLRRTFGPKWDYIIGGWKKLYTEELHISYSSPHIIRTITSRKMRWARHVALMREE
jgi:hypothetical protein